MAKMASIKRKRITLPRTTTGAETNSCNTSPVVDKGHFVVYSVDQKRFVLPLEYLKNKIVMELFNLAEELGYQEMGISSCLVMQTLWNM
ncbi:auxin-responsive family protein [Hibiscus syriacus]|uniref:Auxin-responsive family protein n=1 Tax=Hibiscus syriacus TaxID=106335 RepID=A0A6A3C6L3_HIBSY|nr:auxin-responsive family protein [Hibiscus syriacus]